MKKCKQFWAIKSKETGRYWNCGSWDDDPIGGLVGEKDAAYAMAEDFIVFSLNSETTVRTHKGGEFYKSGDARPEKCKIIEFSLTWEE